MCVFIFTFFSRGAVSWNSRVGVKIFIIYPSTHLCIKYYYFMLIIFAFFFLDPGVDDGESSSINHKEKNTSACAGCLNSIDEDECIQALGQEWHLDCFR